MRRLSHIVAILAFVAALLAGAAGGALACGTAADHHAAEGTPAGHPPAHAPAQGPAHAPVHGVSYKAALTVAAPCCPAAEAPARHAVAVPRTVARVAWTPTPDHNPAARHIAPEPRPPKTTL